MWKKTGGLETGFNIELDSSFLTLETTISTEDPQTFL